MRMSGLAYVAKNKKCQKKRCNSLADTEKVPTFASAIERDGLKA